MKEGTPHVLCLCRWFTTTSTTLATFQGGKPGGDDLVGLMPLKKKTLKGPREFVKKEGGKMKKNDKNRGKKGSHLNCQLRLFNPISRHHHNHHHHHHHHHQLALLSAISLPPF
jgi:hypothetical protein